MLLTSFRPNSNTNKRICVSCPAARNVSFTNVDNNDCIFYISEDEFWNEKHAAGDNWLVLMWWVTFILVHCKQFSCKYLKTSQSVICFTIRRRYIFCLWVSNFHTLKTWIANNDRFIMRWPNLGSRHLTSLFEFSWQ